MSAVWGGGKIEEILMKEIILTVSQGKAKLGKNNGVN